MCYKYPVNNNRGKLSYLGFICIVLAAGFFSAAIHSKYEKDILLARQHYLTEQHTRSAEIASRLEWVFNHTYENLRTIARLPGVQSIDRHAADFAKDAYTTVQELYNNVAVTTSISEIYIVPQDLEPDATDPVTAKPQEPILMFDQLIVGRTSVTQSEADDQKSSLEETEIYEYRLLKEQLSWFKAHFPSYDSVKGLSYPAISGKEVITCDNSRTNPAHPDDRDRSGLVYSVPFFDADGHLKGCISGIFLTHIFRDILPSQNYALLNHDNAYHVFKSKDTDSQPSLPWINQGKKDPSLVYSETIRLNIADASGSWMLWAGLPDQFLWQRQDVQLARQTAMLQYFLVIALALIAFLIIWNWDRQKRFLAETEIKLEKAVQERSEELKKSQQAEVVAAVATQTAQNKSDFLAAMSHEIRTPLNSVIGFCELLSRTELKPEQKEFVENIQSNGDLLLSVVNDVLDFSKYESGRMPLENTAFHLGALITDTIRMVSPQVIAKKLELQQNLAGNIPLRLSGDARRLKQVLINLLVNAVKFTPKGTIKIIVEMINETPAKAHLRLSVKDSGIGIPKEAQKSLFQAFAQASVSTARQYGGTGLGLAICKQIVHAMDGKIWIESEEDKGTAVVFEAVFDKDLSPITPAGASAAPLPSKAEGTADAPDQRSCEGLRVFAVDDVAANRKLLKALLDKLGCVSVFAEDGKEAVEHLRQNISRYDICLMDAQMPGLNGDEATRIIRAEISQHFPIIALTAATFKDEQERFKNAGMNDFLPKPLSLAGLKDMLLKYTSK